MSKGVTPKSEAYSKWYTDIITKAQLADYGPVKGTMVIRPYGYGIWETVQSAFDKEFKNTGHVNAYFPLFIPKSFLSKEAEHVEGFAKECAVVTHSRLKATDDGKAVTVDPESKLEEEIIVRPTSETVIWSMYKKWITSYRDLPILINQWANVVRWEMRTRLFLRTSEFLWQEGHTAHATEDEAKEETLKILDIYKKVLQDILAIPVLTGLKSESEKFAGAVETYCIEAMMGDKKALQAGTSHYLGQNFAKAFDVTFQTEDNTEELVYATSWGVSTRLIGALIMVHGDDKGLRLPPKVAPTQVVIVPIIHKDSNPDDIHNYINNLTSTLKDNNIRINVDMREKLSPGHKFNEWEMKGIPIRVEVGPRDMENQELVICRRDENTKQTVNINDASNVIIELLDSIQSNLFNQAQSFMDSHTVNVNTWDEFKENINNGFVICGWDGQSESESKIKNETKATIRCLPFEQNIDNLQCVYSGNKAKYVAVFSKAY
tara:strand:+ start:948 stop:2417 length:1470 start_codon:yes stop_codon:yes gene_type:complete